MDMKDVRKYAEATFGKLTPAKAQEMARSLLHGQARGKEQVQKAAQELLEWSNRNRERMTEMIRREVREQLRSMGVATREDLDALKRRVRELERGGKATTTKAKRATASKRATTRKPSTGSPNGARSDKGGS